MKVRGWEKFQHYKDRNPPWIKLHKTLLDDYEFQRLPLASKALAPMLWLLASEQIDGTIDGHPEKLAFRLRWTEKDIIDGVLPLIEKGFIVIASDALSTCYQRAIPETEREEERKTEKRQIPSKKTSSEYSDDFLIFWKAYPRKESKGDAWKAWNSENPEVQKILDALQWQIMQDQWLKEKGQFIPLPSTYLRAKKWQDEKPTSVSGSSPITRKCEHPGCQKDSNLRTSKGYRCTDHMHL